MPIKSMIFQVQSRFGFSTVFAFMIGKKKNVFN